MPQPYPNGELVIVIDCSDLDRSARFWSGVLGYTAGRAVASPYRSLQPESGVGIDVLLQRVPDIKRQKNRLHLDLRTPDLEAEVARVLELGATLLTRQPVEEDGWYWHVLADPMATSSACSSHPEPAERFPPASQSRQSHLSSHRAQDRIPWMWQL